MFLLKLAGLGVFNLALFCIMPSLVPKKAQHPSKRDWALENWNHFNTFRKVFLCMAFIAAILFEDAILAVMLKNFQFIGIKDSLVFIFAQWIQSL